MRRKPWSACSRPTWPIAPRRRKPSWPSRGGTRSLPSRHSARSSRPISHRPARKRVTRGIAHSGDSAICSRPLPSRTFPLARPPANVTTANTGGAWSDVHPYRIDAGVRRLRDHARTQGRDGQARRHRFEGGDRDGLAHAALALPARPRVRGRRSLAIVLHCGARQRCMRSALFRSFPTAAFVTALPSSIPAKGSRRRRT